MKAEELRRDILLDEAMLAFNQALTTAKQKYPYRWKQINQAKKEIQELIESSENPKQNVDGYMKRKATYKIKTREYRNKDWLYDQYWNKKRSLSEVGAECGATPGAVLKWMKRYDIKRRNLSEALRLRKPYKFTDKTKHRISEARKKPAGEASLHDIYLRYKNGAIRRGKEFSLTKPQFRKLTSTPCAYCGVLPSNWIPSQKFNGYYVYNGIDRADNQKGYTVDNCVSCCKICNRAKRELSVGLFKEWIEKVYQKTIKGEI